MILAPIITALSTMLVTVTGGLLPLVAAQAIVGIGLAVGSFMLSRLLTPRQRPPGQEFEAKVGANVPLFCVYGRQKLGGLIMPPVQTARRAIHVRVVGAGWHDAIEAIVIDGQRCRFVGIAGQWSDAGKPFQGDVIAGTPSGPGDGVGDPPWTPGLQAAGPGGSAWATTHEYGNNVRVKFYDGRPVQTADATLIGQSGEDGVGRKHWTAGHVGNSVAYVLIDIEPNTNKNLSANPQIEFIVRGRRLWDPRKDVAYGGTGSHDRASPATWEWSDNCALAATDYRLGLFVAGKKVFGIGTPISRIRIDSRIAAANVCDTPRPLLGGREEPMWRIAALVSGDRVHRDNLQVFYDAMAGWETERGGTYRLVAGGPQVPVVAITDADLVKGPRKYKAKKPRSDRYNGVAGKFADPFHGYELQDLPLRTSSEDEGEDGGERLLMTLTMSQVPSQTQAQHLMEIARRRARLSATSTVTVPPRLRDPEVMDAVVWTSAFHGGAAKTFQIQSPWAKNRNMTLTWGLVETSDQIWPWDPAQDQLDPLVAADLPAAIDKLAEVAGFAVAAASQPGEGGQIIPVFICSWTPILDLTVDAVVVKYRPVGATEWSQRRFDTTDTLAAGEGKIDSGVQAATAYEFEADLLTTPPRYTTITTPVPVTSSPHHVVKKAVITDGVEPGAIVIPSLAADALALTEKARESVVGMFTELLSRTYQERLIRAEADGNFAQIRERFETVVTNQEAFADALLEVTAQFNSVSAETRFRMTAYTGIPGVAARIAAEARVGSTGPTGETTWHPAGWAIDVVEVSGAPGTYRGVFTITADYLFIRNTAGDLVAYFDTIANIFTLDTIRLRNAIIDGRISGDAGVRTDSRLRFGNRFYGDYWTTRRIDSFFDGSMNRSVSLQLRMDTENFLHVYNGLGNVLGSWQITPETVWPAGIPYLEVRNATGSAFSRIWPDGQVEVGDYSLGGSNWGFWIAKKPWFMPFEMDPLNVANRLKFQVSTPTFIRVPAGKFSARAKSWGAGGWGGDGAGGGQGHGGPGAYVYCEFSVTPGELLRLDPGVGSLAFAQISGLPGIGTIFSTSAGFVNMASQPHSGMTGFGATGLGLISGGARRRWQMASPGAAAAIISRGPPIIGNGSIISVAAGGGAAIGPYPGYPGGHVGGSGGNPGSMYGKPGTADTASTWSGAGGGYEGGGYAANAGSFGDASNCYRGLAGTNYTAPFCTGVAITIGTLGSRVAPNNGDADRPAGIDWGYGGFSNMGGAVPPGVQGLIVIEFV